MNDGYKAYASQEWINENNPIKIINKSCHIADLDIGTYIIESNLFDGPDVDELIRITLANVNEEDQSDDNFWEIYSGTLTINDRYEEETDEYIRVATSFIANGNMNTPDWITLSEMQDDEGNIYMESEICSIKNAGNVEMFMLISTKFKIELEDGIEVGKWYSKLDHYWMYPSSNIPASALVEDIDENTPRFKVPTAKAVYDCVEALKAEIMGDLDEIGDLVGDEGNNTPISLVPLDINEWQKNTVAQSAYISRDFDGNENKVYYKGVDGYEYIYYPVSFKANRRYVFSLSYKTENVNYSSYGEPQKPFIAFVSSFKTSDTQWSNRLAATAMNSTPDTDYTAYSLTYDCLNDFEGYAVLDTGNITDGISGTLYIKDISLVELGGAE